MASDPHWNSDSSDDESSSASDEESFEDQFPTPGLHHDLDLDKYLNPEEEKEDDDEEDDEDQPFHAQHTEIEEEDISWDPREPTLSDLKNSLAVRKYVCHGKFVMPDICTVDVEPMKRLAEGMTAMIFLARRFDDQRPEVLRVANLADDLLQKEFASDAFCRYYLQCHAPTLSPFMYGVQTCTLQDPPMKVGLSTSVLMEGNLADLALSQLFTEEQQEGFKQQLDTLLRRLHNCMVRHRDVTLKNVLYVHDWDRTIRFALTDFGSSCIFYNPGNDKLPGYQQFTAEILQLLPDQSDPQTFHVYSIEAPDKEKVVQLYDMYLHADVKALDTVKQEFLMLQRLTHLSRVNTPAARDEIQALMRVVSPDLHADIFKYLPELRPSAP